MKHDCATEDRKLAIDRPCSACSAGDGKMEHHDHCPPFREPVASPQSTRPDAEMQTRILDAAYAQQKRMESAAQPAAGTTPQAERPRPIEAIRNALSKLESQICRNPDLPAAYRRICNDGFDAIQHLEFVTNNFCEKHLEVALCSTGPCVMCRAVAPVETPEGKHIHVCNAQLPAAHKVCVCFECGESYPNKRVAVETRLTAEQFWPEWAKANKAEDGNDLLLVPFKEPRRAYILFAEAFRDKSDELKKPERYFLLRYETEAAISAGLREEIERLAQMHRLVGNDYQYVYGSRHQVQKELAELRVKLTAAEAEVTALRERERKGLTLRDVGEG